ncbi:hypothetical protein [Inquilinus sp. CA228]|uniref:hypothetical protein n=1 Tax=Inquilinus sp. CA228 TaxID=3455609 RepID=UPI003F8D2F0A
MPWFEFTADFDFRASRRVVLAYRAGTRLLVPTATAKAAEAAGAGRRGDKPEAAHERP